MYSAMTHDIEVSVAPDFNAERSSPANGHYFWAYTMTITNHGQVPVQLLTRHWIITDASGQQQEVKGKGVVGEQPEILPGESYEYTSGVPLPTASGFMRGSYGMIGADGRAFDIAIPAFSLDAPTLRRTLN